MRFLVAALVVLTILSGMMFLWCQTTVWAQLVAPTACGQNVVCLGQRVKDLQDYREFLEDQLALAKSLNQSLQAQVQGCRTVPELPARPEPGTP